MALVLDDLDDEQRRGSSELDQLSALSFVSSIETRSSSTRLCGTDLPSGVHKWTRKHVELLNIYYEKEYLDNPLKVLEKIPTLQPLSKEQMGFIKNIQSLLHFDASYRKYDETYNFYTIENGLKSVLESVIKKVNKDAELERFVNFKVSRFLKCLHRFMINMETLRKNHQVYEGNFTQLLGSFAEMCCIEAVECSKANQSIWRNLKGTKAVVSKPDFRFYKSGLQDSLFFGDEEVVVSVIEVKQSSEKLAKRLMEMNINSNQSSTSSGSSERLENSEIETDLNKRVLGQHAGELLLDLDRFRVKKTVYVDENYIMTMPGMIVDGTQVFFTLLEMARSHHRKLKYNEDLDAENDKAIIYYSRPLDILVEQDRITLIENFMRLNNI